MTSKLKPEIPALSPKEDILGYAKLSEQIARSICSCAPREGIVFAIYGDWGSGKSTVLNFVRTHLTEGALSATAPAEFRFNPWWFSGSDNLLLTFFSELEAFLNGDNRFTAVSNVFRNFRDALLQLEMPIEVAVYDALKIKADPLKTLSKIWKKESPFADTRDKLAEALKNSPPILVTIDDLDRLQSSELCSILKIVGAVANLPNLIYLLAFDKNVVAHAIEQQLKMPGHAYLEKIVQVPFDLPLPDPAGIQTLLLREFHAHALPSTKRHLLEDSRVQEMMLAGLTRILRTPRRVFRLTNSFAASYGALVNEVNAADFLAIEAIRLFTPLIYDAIRQQPEMFAESFAALELDEFRSFHLNLKRELQVAGSSQQKISDAYSLLTVLFPKLEVLASEEIKYSQDAVDDWATRKLICSVKHLRNYLMFGIAAYDVPSAEIDRIVAADDVKTASSSISATIGGDKVSARKITNMLARIREELNRSSIGSDKAETLFEALAGMADSLRIIGEEPASFSPMNKDLELLLEGLLKAVLPQRRVVLLDRIINQDQPSAAMLDLIRALGSEHGYFGTQRKKKSSGQLISAVDLDRYVHRGVLTALLMLDGAEGEKPKDLLSAILFLRATNPKKLTEGLQKAMVSDGGLLAVLRSFMNTAWVAEGRKQEWRSIYEYDLLSTILDVPNYEPRLRALMENSELDSESLFALKEIVRNVDDFRRERRQVTLTDGPLDDNSFTVEFNLPVTIEVKHANYWNRYERSQDVSEVNHVQNYYFVQKRKVPTPSVLELEILDFGTRNARLKVSRMP